MDLRSFFKVTLVRVFSFFCFQKKSKVIFYHDVHDSNKYSDMSTSIKLFATHIRIIRESGYEIVDKITRDYGQIEICFDDAFLGLHENIKFFKNLKIPIHLFVISSFLGKDNYMNQKQLSEISNLEFVRISSHTHTHANLNKINIVQVQYELKKSKEILEALINRPVDGICFPEGKFNSQVINIANLVGYKYQYSSLPGFFINKFKSTVLKRSLVQFASEKQLKEILIGADHILFLWYKFKHFKR